MAGMQSYSPGYYCRIAEVESCGAIYLEKTCPFSGGDQSDGVRLAEFERRYLDLKAKLDVTAHAFSASAKEKIEAAGGSASTISA